MHVIKRPTLREYGARHPDAAAWLEAFWKVVSKAHWHSLQNVRQIYQAADQVGRCLVFNVRGNQYRLIVTVKYERQLATGKMIQGVIYVKHFLTHAEYNKGRWKGTCHEHK